MRIRSKRMLVGGAVLLVSAVTASAQSGDEARAAVRAALLQWSADFNARDTQHVCDLFSPDLRYNYQGLPERGYDEICTTLHRSLSDKSKGYHYSSDIRDVIVSGNLAVVRVIWTLTIAPATSSGKDSVVMEPSLDVFRKQADGSWRIVRFVAYGEP
jgi:uncharacterized protein (TIGR02246 family)